MNNGAMKNIAMNMIAMKMTDFYNSFEMTEQSVKIILADFVKNVNKLNLPKLIADCVIVDFCTLCDQLPQWNYRN